MDISSFPRANSVISVISSQLTFSRLEYSFKYSALHQLSTVASSIALDITVSLRNSAFFPCSSRISISYKRLKPDVGRSAWKICRDGNAARRSKPRSTVSRVLPTNTTKGYSRCRALPPPLFTAVLLPNAYTLVFNVYPGVRL